MTRNDLTRASLYGGSVAGVAFGSGVADEFS